jgi:hypothetical protein
MELSGIKMAATIGARDAEMAKERPIKLYVMEKPRQTFKTTFAYLDTWKNRASK